MEDTCEYVNEKKLSDYSDIPLSTLRNWRFRGQGPPYKKISPRMVRYSLKEFDAWMESRTVKPFRE